MHVRWRRFPTALTSNVTDEIIFQTLGGGFRTLRLLLLIVTKVSAVSYLHELKNMDSRKEFLATNLYKWI